MIDKDKIPESVWRTLETLQFHGYESFLVGGAVRDLLMGKIPQDFDICTAGTPEEVKKLFPKVVETGLPFGTVTVIEESLGVEVTTFRARDSALKAQVEKNTVREDVSARDFTINGLLFDGKELIDLVGGLPDLLGGKIKGIGQPCNRYREDPLRMIRGIRFHCQLGFEIEKKTLEAIFPQAYLIERVAPERIREELIKILISEQPASGFNLLHQTGLLKYILPELENCFGFEQRNPHHNQDVFHHIMTVLEKTSPDLILRLAALFHDIGKPVTFSLDEKEVGHFYGHELQSQKMTDEIMSRLKWDRKTKDQVTLLVGEHMHHLSPMKGKALKRMLNRLGKENMERLLDLQAADLKACSSSQDSLSIEVIKKEINRILATQEPISLKDLAIGGKDLIEIGYPPGPEIGKALHLLLEKVQENPGINSSKELKKLARGFRPIF
ncbi:CCA tRNA nucleotidyltransferase [Dehalobacterium formicoaceticum]|uniref:CCA tRNA nucleotidyltransferase n=1 Tax=Dehalobacterium formicoaceticum TaxID=51515 RepID=A0ABT1Y413_9FIRM|nr:CCA tRNA nucleotidyltransferase [Dehalobacterium formicoaceticum]MCR6545614.1 CCA tRNA nucleotidyltransferase [Dehalobacterium formicoaceticum]